MKNSNLTKAKTAKNDEFYTRMIDIENELKHYTNHFKGKVVYCNCDDPNWSNFVKYFYENFETLGLKKLIASCYVDNSIDLFNQNPTDKATYFEYSGIENIELKPTFKNIEVKLLKGNGDFRSVECIDFLKQSDIVVTNPPFSLFREFIAQLTEHKKEFLVIGSMNAITYNNIFKIIKKNNVWLGITYPKNFLQPTGNFKKFGNILWFTNLEHYKLNEKLILCKKYNSEEYPKYDNYDVIEVSKTKDIPIDYKGVMGVPISFLTKYNSNQFELLGIANSERWIDYECLTIINGKKNYNRLLIKYK